MSKTFDEAMLDRTTVAGIEEVARALVERGHGVALTGAGLSVPSGIPDFRSPGGLWERFDPMEYATIQGFRADPARVWQMLDELSDLVQGARPNPAHEAMARLERRGVLAGVVTQNIDNLHQAAGSNFVVEFHGNGSRLVCIACGETVPAARRPELGTPPCCACGQVLKPDVVFFGEMIPGEAMQRSLELVEACQVMLMAGTSASVAPASGLPLAAARQGALLAEFNLEPTALSQACDVAVHGDATVTLPALAERVEQLQMRSSNTGAG